MGSRCMPRATLQSSRDEVQTQPISAILEQPPKLVVGVAQASSVRFSQRFMILSVSTMEYPTVPVDRTR
jgi:hypothetical protein